MRRTGIDMSSTRCILVDAQPLRRRRDRRPPSVRVRRFATSSTAADGEVLTAELKALRERDGFSRRAWVNLWDLRSSHQYLLLPSATPVELESAARHHGASALGMDEADVTVTARIGSTRTDLGHDPKTEVSFFAASSHEIRQRLQPLVDAGFLIEGVTTPCGALWAQARLRRPSLRGEVHAHVALGATQSAIGIFCNGALLYARDLDWGYTVAAGSEPTAARESLSRRLASELRQSFLYLKQYWEDDVSLVLLCGDMPEIRSLTAPLIERLNIEVEMLDTLEGIDPRSIPEGFADQSATYRLATSIAGVPPPVNLLPADMTAHRSHRRAQRIVAAGTAAAIALAAFLYAQASVRRQEAERDIRVVREEMSRAVVPVSVDTQGPAIARMLEAVGAAAHAEVIVGSVQAIAAGPHWNVAIEAVATGENATKASSNADAFLRALEASPVFGHPLHPPVRGAADGGGIALRVIYQVRK